MSINIGEPSTYCPRASTRRGTSAILVVSLFGVLMVVAWFAINVSLLQRHHATAQISADLASRYGVDVLSRMDQSEMGDLEDVKSEIEGSVRDNWRLTSDQAQHNDDDLDIEIEIGNASVSSGKATFRPNQKPFNSVRVAVDKNVHLWDLSGKKDLMTHVANDATSAALERDICLVVDRSGSMTFDLTTGTWLSDGRRHPYNALWKSNKSSHRRNRSRWWHYWPHPTRSRWSTMVPAIYGLVDELNQTNQKELFSIVSYSSDYKPRFFDHQPALRNYKVHEAAIEAAPTFDYLQAAEDLEHKYKFDQPVAGGTRIAAGIDRAAEVLTGPNARPYAFKTMILMTDGQDNSKRRPWEAAAQAARQSIRVHTVTFSKHADRNAMKKTAKAGNGQHFHAPDGAALESVFREIAKMPAAAIIE